MNLFNQLVEQAMQSEEALGTVRPAVEKELLHHDILREMSRAGLLEGLTFIGGTCLRACYGSPRLSEDLDFAGGVDFDSQRLAGLGSVLKETLLEKYGLPISVSDPVRDAGSVRTWKLRLQTRPGSKHLPAQRIHIDICSVPSHQPRPALLRNRYGVNMGTDGLIVQVQTREEILADKWVALAFRPNRIQPRDLWDILWLDRHSVGFDLSLVLQKIDDRQKTRSVFATRLRDRLENLEKDPVHQKRFQKEMERFLPASEIREAARQPEFWTLLMGTLREHAALV